MGSLAGSSSGSQPESRICCEPSAGAARNSVIRPPVCMLQRASCSAPSWRTLTDSSTKPGGIRSWCWKLGASSVVSEASNCSPIRLPSTSTLSVSSQFLIAARGRVLSVHCGQFCASS